MTPHNVTPRATSGFLLHMVGPVKDALLFSLIVVAAIIAVLIAIATFSAVLMFVWNAAVVAAITCAVPISFKTAVGLFVFVMLFMTRYVNFGRK